MRSKFVIEKKNVFYDAFFSPNEMVLCPYNPAHRIAKNRLNTHLIKCRRSNPDAKLVACEFNVNHRVPEPELQVRNHSVINVPFLN